MFRANFVLFWIFCQAVFYILVLQMMDGISAVEVINSGKLTYFEFFSLFLAGLVAFAITFATFYIVKWKYRYWWDPKYEVNL
jgi:hypothetical protein